MINKKTLRNLFPLVIVVVVVVAVTVSAVIVATVIIVPSFPNILAASPTINQSGESKYIVLLNGSESVPPVDTNSSGTTKINLLGDNNTATFSLVIENITNAVVGHIHKGADNENGPHVYTLFVIDDPSKQQGALERNGTIVSEKFEGPLADKPMKSLIEILNNGSGYINIHTEQYPKEFLRGKVMPE